MITLALLFAVMWLLDDAGYEKSATAMSVLVVLQILIVMVKFVVGLIKVTEKA